MNNHHDHEHLGCGLIFFMFKTYISLIIYLINAKMDPTRWEPLLTLRPNPRHATAQHNKISNKSYVDQFIAKEVMKCRFLKKIIDVRLYFFSSLYFMR